jgi:hypothetical protein
MIKMSADILGALKTMGRPGASQKPMSDHQALGRVRAAYYHLLAREPEPQGLMHWTTFLQSGGTYEKLLQGFVRSQEFRRRQNQLQTLDDPIPELVRAAYRCVFAREADPEGVAHWEAYLRAGGTYEKLLRSFVRSAEFQRQLSLEVQSPTSVNAPPATLLQRSNIAVIGNCQVMQISRCIQALTGGEMPTSRWVTEHTLLGTQSARIDLVAIFREHDKVFIQPQFWTEVVKHYPEFREKVVLFPSIRFLAFHPDLVHVGVKSSGARLRSPCEDYHSCLALLGWKAGLSIAETQKLYRNEIFRRLGFFHFWQGSAAALLEEGKLAGLALDSFLDEWREHGCFMHSINHPKLFVIADLARMLLKRNGIDVVEGNPEGHAHDVLANSAVWPVYPEIAEKFGIAGNYTFKLESPDLLADQPVRTLDLKGFLEESFALYSQYASDDLVCDRLDMADYCELLEELRGTSISAAVVNAASPLTPQQIQLGASRHSAGAPRFAVLGNCQTGHVARCLQAFLGGKMPKQEWVTTEMLADWESGRSSLEPLFASHDKVLMQPWIWTPLAKSYAAFENQVVLYPSIGFIAYHPDLVPVVVKSTGAAFEDGPAMRCNSSLAFLGWQAGLSVVETADLFRRDIYQRLGFFDYWQSSEVVLLEEGRAAGLPLEDLLAKWRKQGCFMYCHVHPKLSVIADIVRILLKRMEVDVVPGDPILYTHDYLANGIVWPVYPELGEVLGCPGNYAFKLGSQYYSPDSPVHILGLEEFIERSFAAYAKHSPEELACPRLELGSYQALLDELRNRGTAPDTAVQHVQASVPMPTGTATITTPSGAGHPYHGLPSQQFWQRAIKNVSPDQVDPVIKARFHIHQGTRVATAGSCFAQRISERLSEQGFNYLLTEAPPLHLSAAEATRLNYGSFSARFGFVYTARQLLQLIQRAYGNFIPVDSAWCLGDDRFVDPFRPRIEPEGFRSIEQLEASRLAHLAAVRTMFETLDVFVFTLGLTEAWRAKADGAVFPIAPGVAGGTMDHDHYEFVNFTAAEVDSDLETFLALLAKINPGAQVILTVSPVPLAATYTERHVLVATTYSKSVLRAATEQIVQRHPHCDYFPSYEIITGSFNRGRYFGEDLRDVSPAGVDHVMRLFFEHYAPSVKSNKMDENFLAEARKNIHFLCDEELLAATAR